MLSLSSLAVERYVIGRWSPTNYAIISDPAPFMSMELLCPSTDLSSDLSPRAGVLSFRFFFTNVFG